MTAVVLLGRIVAGTPSAAPAASPAAVTQPSSAPPVAEASLPAVLPSLAPSLQPVASPTPAAPELVALVPKTINGTKLTVESALGTDVLGSDPGSRALLSAVAALGKTGSDLQIADGYDPTGALDVTILAFRVPGVDPAKLEPIIMNTWLSGSSSGATQAPVQLGTVSATRVTYGDEGAAEYVYTSGDAVFVVQTSDEKLATSVASAAP